ncbi:hypothetical protein [Pseudomarimonas salicorniae]|uniref:Uncharacterized protein n=1 Tax=Pseudomarimonas salicorniae TaxID=2933270 RepID=A0ABT0GKI1_9GAMM|nr:hypothetical protein [Lysobacter sp. CAU 1642]MCK7594552.1 hypothetical protein [Lysobacter sp. CAU 1642]
MKDNQTARRVAIEAARLVARDEAASIDAARRKAARRLGIRDSALLPDDGMVREELSAYRGLFGGEARSDPARLQLALDAMEFMRQFQPELAEDPDLPLTQADLALRILLYSEDPDAPVQHLLSAGRRHRIRRARLLKARRDPLDVDVIEVTVEAERVEFWPLPARMRGEPLFDAALGEPLPRTRLARLRAREGLARGDD